MGARWTLRCLLMSIAALQLAACSNGTGSVEARPPTQAAQENFVGTVRGAVTGLAAQGLVLQNNGTDDLAVSASGNFSFPLTIPAGSPYNVTVRTQPTSPAQTCTVANGSGTMGSTDVTNVAVSCSTGSVSIGVTITGLFSGSSVGLTNNGNDNLTVTQNGQFTFSRNVATGSPYFVTVSSNPANPPQSCAVTNGSGTAGAINVTNVVVACSTNYTVSGAITGLVGSGLTLQLNGANDLIVPPATSSFGFGTFLGNGATYAVTIATQPSSPSQVCTLANATGTVGAANVTNVSVACVIPTHFVGGRVSGLAGTGLTLTNNGIDDLPIQSDGEFTFPTKVPFGGTYTVVARSQPRAPQQECTVTNGTGTVTGDVRNIQIRCATTAYRLLVNVTGLLGSNLRLRNSAGGAPLDVPADGTYEFPQRVANGSQYRVIVDRSPTNPTQSCSEPSGIMDIQDVTVSVTCTTSSFTIGGTANNLVGSGLILQNNGEQLPVNASPFTFPAIPSGSTYNIQVIAQPSSPTQVCTLANASGTVGGENITNVRLDCVTTEFAVRGQLSGLVGSGLVLQNNGSDNLALAADGPFAFPDSLPQGAPYSVTVATAPSNPAQDCAISNAVGSMGAGDVTNVQVSCTVVEFTVGGNVSGLSGSGQPGSSVLLQNNGGDIIEVATDSAFTFPLRVRTGQNYNVSVLTQPSNPTRLCSVVNGAGIMGSAAVTNVQVFCIPLPIFP